MTQAEEARQLLAGFTWSMFPSRIDVVDDGRAFLCDLVELSLRIKVPNSCGPGEVWVGSRAVMPPDMLRHDWNDYGPAERFFTWLHQQLLDLVAHELLETMKLHGQPLWAAHGPADATGAQSSYTKPEVWLGPT